jgi:hypothetical protein
MLAAYSAAVMLRWLVALDCVQQLMLQGIHSSGETHLLPRCTLLFAVLMKFRVFVPVTACTACTAMNDWNTLCVSMQISSSTLLLLLLLLLLPSAGSRTLRWAVLAQDMLQAQQACLYHLVPLCAAVLPQSL